MTNKEKYKKELLARHLKSDLSNDERHELEKMALDDPFLFEALNGFAQANENHTEDIAMLKKKVINGKVKKRSNWFLPMRIAASLLVVVGLGWWIANSQSEGSSDAMAKVSTAQDTDGGEREEMVAEVSDELQNKVTKANEIVTARDKINEVGKAKKIVRENKDISPATADIQFNNGAFQSDGPVVDGVPYKTTPVQAEPMPVGNSEGGDVSLIENSMEGGEVQEQESKEVKSEAQSAIVEEDELISMDANIEMVEEEGAENDDVIKEEVSYQRPKGAIPPGVIQKKQTDRAFIENAAAKPSVANFNTRFNSEIRKQFSGKEKRKLNDGVELQFAIIDGVISEYKVVPSQGERIDNMLLEILQQSAELLPEQNALLITYEIGF